MANLIDTEDRENYRETRGLPHVVVDLEAILQSLKRSIAAYSALMNALSSVRGDKSADGRVHGLPIFEFKGTIDGVNVIHLVSDMNRLTFPKQHAEHALIPHITAFAGDVADTAARLEPLTQELMDMVRDILPNKGTPKEPANGPATQPQRAQPSRERPTRPV